MRSAAWSSPSLWPRRWLACLVIALLALVAWVTAHAVAVGVGMAAVVVTGLAFLRALTGARTAGFPPHGGCCR